MECCLCAIKVLLEFKNLEILYLHGNSISNIKEVDKLANLSGLRKLTLHGNEIEKEKVRLGICRNGTAVPSSFVLFMLIWLDDGDRFSMVLFSALEQTHRAHVVCDSE